MNYPAILFWLVILIFVGIIIYCFCKWRKLPTWLKGMIIGLAFYWFLFFLSFGLIDLFTSELNVIYILASPFIYLLRVFKFPEMVVGAVIADAFIGTSLIFGLVGALIGLLINKFKKRSSS